MSPQVDISDGLGQDRHLTLVGQSKLFPLLWSLRDALDGPKTRVGMLKASLSKQIQQWETTGSFTCAALPSNRIPDLSTPSPAPRSESSYGYTPSQYTGSDTGVRNVSEKS